MNRFHRAVILSLASLVAATLSPTLAAQATVSSYYRNELQIAIGAKELGPYNQVELGADGLVYTVSWEGVDRSYGYIQEYAPKEYVPSYAYYGLDAKALPLPARAMQAGPFRSGRARFLEHDREALYGYLRTDGGWAIRPRFAQASDFAGSLAAAREPGGRWGTIGLDGRWACVPSFAEIRGDPARGVILARRSQKDALAYYDALTGAPIAEDDRRLAQSRVDSAPRLGYQVREGRSAVVSGTDFANYVDVVAPDGRVVSSGVFTGVNEIRDGLAVVALGYHGDWSYEGPSTSSLSPTQGAYGLYDFGTGRFVVPPSASQIVSVEGGAWFVKPHGGTASIIDDTGRKLRDMPSFDLIWVTGAVSCGVARSSQTASGLAERRGEIAIPASVNDDKVRVRSSPSLKGAIVTELGKGTRVTVLAFHPAVETIGTWTGMWTKVRLEGGREGWVFSRFLDLYRYCQ